MSPSETPAPSPEHPLKTCSCGHDRNHFSVSPEGHYSAWGWFCNLFGITAKPKKLVFRCRQCDEVFDETEDESLRMHHV